MRESATHWYRYTTQTARDFNANCEAGNRDFGTDSHWIEQWEVVEGAPTDDGRWVMSWQSGLDGGSEKP